MPSLALRYLLFLALALVACGGHTAPARSDGGAPPVEDGGPPPLDAGPDVTLLDGDQACVQVEATMFDTSCTTSADCAPITAGLLCPMGCLCRNAAINASSVDAWEQLVDPLGLVGCHCATEGTPTCVAGQCVMCGNQFGDPPGCEAEAGTCVDIDPASFDESCQSDMDCTLAPTGKVCSGECGCGGGAVSRSAATSIQSELTSSSIQLSACPCPPPGTWSRCVDGTCTGCPVGGGGPSGCPDGG
jgi:hypothetical protein